MTAELSVKLHSPAGVPANDPAPVANVVEPPTVAKRLIRLTDLFALIDVSKATGHRLIAIGKIGPCPPTNTRLSNTATPGKERHKIPRKRNRRAAIGSR